jgi:hypothetical protein
MIKNFTITLTIILVIAAGLFWREVWGVFAGMSVLESLKQIVTFVLHVAVATIAAYAAMTLPEFIKPWMRAFKVRQRQMRRGRFSVAGQRSKVNPQRMPKPKPGQAIVIVKDESQPIDLKWK